MWVQQPLFFSTKLRDNVEKLELPRRQGVELNLPYLLWTKLSTGSKLILTLKQNPKIYEPKTVSQCPYQNFRPLDVRV
jgi:hypothetical protein